MPKAPAASNPVPKGSLGSGKGKDPQVKRIAKHPVKSGFFTKKSKKGQC